MDLKLQEYQSLLRKSGSAEGYFSRYTAGADRLPDRPFRLRQIHLAALLGGLERPGSGQVLQIGDPPPDSLNPLPTYSSISPFCRGARSRAISSWCWKIIASASAR